MNGLGVLYLWASLASGGSAPHEVGSVPDGVRPVVAPFDAPAQYLEHLKTAGREPVNLACGPLWAEVALLCFRVREGSRRRWTTEEDLRDWGVSVEGLRGLMVSRGLVQMAEAATVVPIVDMDASTLQISDPGGWAAVALLHPSALERSVGGVPLLVAAPTTEVVLAWRPDDEQVNKAVAVSVYDTWEEGPNRVTPQVFLWTGKQWLPYLEVHAPAAP